MAKHVFRLQRVLRVRHILEEEARAAWSAAEQRARDAEDRSRGAADARTSALAHHADRRADLAAAEVVVMDGCLDEMARAAARARERARTARFQADRAFQPYTERRRERRALELYAERDEKRHREEERRREAEETDETAVQRAARRAREANRNRRP